MVVKEAKIPEWAEVWGMPDDVLNKISSQIDYFHTATVNLGAQVHSIATETIDLLLATPVPGDIDPRRHDIVVRYSSVLTQFSKVTQDPDRSFNHFWTELEQSVSFYLLDAGHNDSTKPDEISGLIGEIACLRDRIPGLMAQISNLSSAIEGSAGALPGLEDAIADATGLLNRASGELNMGAAIMTRLIGTAEHLHKLLTEK